jgi:hypothetical protein
MCHTLFMSLKVILFFLIILGNSSLCAQNCSENQNSIVYPEIIRKIVTDSSRHYYTRLLNDAKMYGNIVVVNLNKIEVGNRVKGTEIKYISNDSICDYISNFKTGRLVLFIYPIELGLSSGRLKIPFSFMQYIMEGRNCKTKLLLGGNSPLEIKGDIITIEFD